MKKFITLLLLVLVSQVGAEEFVGSGLWNFTEDGEVILCEFQNSNLRSRELFHSWVNDSTRYVEINGWPLQGYNGLAWLNSHEGTRVFVYAMLDQDGIDVLRVWNLGLGQERYAAAVGIFDLEMQDDDICIQVYSEGVSGRNTHFLGLMPKNIRKEVKFRLVAPGLDIQNFWAVDGKYGWIVARIRACEGKPARILEAEVHATPWLGASCR